ncbi:MAG: BMP family ABC transporter substrate-binding protein [Oscillospiraceae bacterium]|jgi:basic membrane protein A|nr:BMP family ABC transporter substrate-binding protein [Oscillospiraceae bacterium]
MKKRTKLLAILLAAALTLGLAACVAADPDGGAGPATAAAAPGESTGFEAIPAEDIVVGILHITSSQDESGYTYAHHKGFLEMAAELGLRDDQLVVKDSIDDQDVTATQNALREMVDAGCDIIFATSYNYMDSMEKFAGEYPDIIFSHCSGFKSNGANFNNYFGRIYQGRYLAGIAAGLKMKEAGKPLAGYVAAMNNTNSEVTGGLNAWALGIQSVYPEAEVKVKVTGSWYDPEGEAAAAQALIDAGCFVIGQHCDTNGPQLKAQDNKVFGCGYNSDMTGFAPDAHLVAPIWNWGAYYTAAVKAVVAGAWAPENVFIGMAEGLIDISPLNGKAIAPGTAQAIEEAKAAIIDGSLVIFGTALTKADGTVIGHPLTDAEITGGIDYYIKGVSLL